jgi:hypothetical protein
MTENSFMTSLHFLRLPSPILMHVKFELLVAAMKLIQRDAQINS